MENFHNLHLAVAGNIGAGKTTLVQKLARHFGWKMHLEAVDNNPYLADFYQDMTRWAFPLQVYFLQSRFNQLLDIQNSPHTYIQDRTVYEDAKIFAKKLHDSASMTLRDYQTYLSVFDILSRLIRPPELLIYLRASVPKLAEQISKRGRDFETEIRLDYLEDLNKYYESWISSYEEGPLLIIDVDNLNYVDREADFDLVVGNIREKLGI